MSAPTTKSEAKEEKVKKVSDKDLDLSNANRGVWLVKVPKYIAERWESGNTGKDVGKLKITRVQGQKPKVSFSLEDSLTKAMPENKEIEQKTSIPKDHTFMISANANQTLAVFSCTTGEPTDDALRGRSSSGTVASVERTTPSAFAENLYGDTGTATCTLGGEILDSQSASHY